MIKIKDLSYRRGCKRVINIGELHVRCGERVALLGPSGSGKTTLLRLIAGLEKEHEGTIRLDGVVVTGKRYMPPHKRGLNMLTQDYGLWPHLTTLQHLAFVRSRGKTIRSDESDIELLELVGLGQKEKVYPSQLSGGEQQRLALARTLARSVKILLLDEPFSNVDPVLSRELMGIMENLHVGRNMTRIMVTHDIQEAIRNSDRLLVIEEGELVYQGSWQQLCAHPRERWSSRLVEMYGE